MQKVKKTIRFIFAEDEDFSLEYRLFLSALIVGIFTSVLGSVINWILITSLPAVIVPFSLSFILFVIYYFARFNPDYALGN